MEDSARDRTQVHGNMEGATQREAPQNNYNTIDFGPETQVFPGEDDRRGIQEDDATRTKTNKPDKTNEVRAKLATGSKRTVTVTAEGLTVSLPPPPKRQKISKDQKKKPAKGTPKYKLEESSSAFLWPAGAGVFDLNVGERPRPPRVSLLDMVVDNHRDATPPSNIPLNRNTSTITNADTSTPMKPPRLSGLHGMGDVVMETRSGNVLERLNKVARKAR